MLEIKKGGAADYCRGPTPLIPVSDYIPDAKDRKPLIVAIITENDQTRFAVSSCPA